MPNAIFFNLPCSNLKRSKAFFEAVGWNFNPQFTNDDAACPVISDTIYAMLHTQTGFCRLTKKGISDAHKTTEVLLVLQVESKEAVHALVGKAGRPMPGRDQGNFCGLKTRVFAASVVRM